MSTNPLWLERLNRATNYGELQEIFADILADAQSTGDHVELAQSIDEAIRRLEVERARDEIGLQEVQSQYDAFRASNKGMVGWLKRHLPFTETRRKEHEHRGNVAEQTAEILGDNLVIARAQMVKERFQPTADRKLGHPPADWRLRLDTATADRQPTQLGAALQDLSQEIERSRAFLDAIQHDMDAFSHAEFKTAEDRQRRDKDVAAARLELADLSHEVDDKAALKKTGLKQLAARAVSELESTDAAFHADGQQLDKLRTVLAHATDAHGSLGKLIESAAALGKLSKELHGLPTEIQQIRDALMRLENQHAAAQTDCARKAALLGERHGAFEAAQRDVNQTRQLLASAQQFYDAYLAECRANHSLPMMAEAEEGASDAKSSPPIPADSPLLHQLNETKASAHAAQSRLREVTSPFESAKREVDTCQAAVLELAKNLQAERDKLQTLERRVPQLRHEMTAAIDRTHEAFAAATAALGLYLASDRGASALPFRPQELAAGTFGWLGPRGLERSLADALVQAERDYQRFLQGSHILDALNKWLDAQLHSVETERVAALHRREVTWKRRCSELLGEQLAKEACAGGLAAHS